MRKSARFLVGFGFVAACGALGPAIGCTIEGGENDIALLESTFPGAKSYLEARGEIVQRSATQLLLRPEVALDDPPVAVAGAKPRWRSSVRSSEVDLLVEEGRLTLELDAGGHGVRVHRSAPSDLRVRLEGERAVVEGEGELHTVFVPLERGVEELVVLRQARSVSYDFSLPAGWSLRTAAGYAGLVEIVDARGHAQSRMRAEAAWASGGDELPIDVHIDGMRATLSVASDAAGVVLLDPAWEDAGTVVQVRRNAASALLPTGQVLITGGAAGVGEAAVTTTELYDPESGTFSAGPEMPGEPRLNHITALMPNGSLLVAGGLATEVDWTKDTSAASVTGSAHATALLYDPVTNAFTETGAMSTPRSRFTATVLHDGRVLVIGGTSSGETFATAEIYDPGSGQFTSAGSLAGPRHEHSAILLDEEEHRVLVCFGSTGGADGQPIGTCTRFDPATSAFSAEFPQPSLPARYGSLAVALHDGKVLLAGGRHPLAAPNTLADAFVFDPSAPTSTAFTPVDDMEVSRFRTGATLLPDGRVVVAGGLHDTLTETEFPESSAEIFVWDGAVGTFAPLPDAIFKTQSPVLQTLPDGSVFLSGLTPAAQIYDFLELDVGVPVQGGDPDASWAGLGLGDFGRRLQHSATLLESGDVLIAGGFHDIIAAERDYPTQTIVYQPSYDETAPANGTFVLGPSLHHARTDHTATRLGDGRVLFVGGSLQSATVPSAELYDPSTGQIVDLGEVLTTTKGAVHTATLLGDGKVLLAGGLIDPENATASAEIFDPSTDTFTQVGDMSEPRAYHTASLLPDGRVLVAGATSFFATSFSATTDIFDPATGQFTPGPSLGEARGFHTAGELPDGRILFAGGSPSGSTEVFDPSTGTISFASPTLPRFLGNLTRLPTGRLVLSGGHAGLGFGSEISAIESFNPVTDDWEPVTNAAGEPQKLAVHRREEAATLMADGRILVSGGMDLTSETSALVYDTVEIIGEELLPTPIPLPVLSPLREPAIPGNTIAVQAAFLVGPGEAGGSSFGSASRPPMAVWLPFRGPPEYGVFTRWSSEGADWRVPAPRYPGPGLLFAVSNGIRSKGLSVNLPPATNGVECTTDGQCASGFCVDGFCCDQRCTDDPATEDFEDTCMACSAAKKGAGDNGVCEPIGIGQDPDNECTALAECPSSTGSCGGESACQSCPVPPQCDGESTIVSEVNKECAPYKCSEDTDQCLEACGTSADCAAGNVCTAQGVCQSPFLDDPLEDGCSVVSGPDAGRSGDDRSALVLVGLLAVLARLRRNHSRRETGRRAS